MYHESSPRKEFPDQNVSNGRARRSAEQEATSTPKPEELQVFWLYFKSVLYTAIDLKSVAETYSLKMHVSGQTSLRIWSY